MDKYAVIQINHRQYIVEADKTYTVDKFPGEVGDKVKFDTLMVADKGKLTIGAPVVDKTKAEVEILEQGKGKKVSTFTYEAKSRRRTRSGHRQRVTTFKVLGIK